MRMPPTAMTLRASRGTRPRARTTAVEPIPPARTPATAALRPDHCSRSRNPEVSDAVVSMMTTKATTGAGQVRTPRSTSAMTPSWSVARRTTVRGRMPSDRPRQRCSAMVRATMTASPTAVRTRRVVSSGFIGVPFLVLSGTRDRAPGLLGVTLKSVPLSITRATPGCRACQASVRRPASACAPGSGPWEGGGVPPKQSSFPAEMSLIRHGRIRSSSDGHLSLRSQTG